MGYKYKYKNSVTAALFNDPYLEYDEAEHMLNEVKAVYRKAKTFDKLLATYERHKNGHTHDLKSALGTKAIEIMEGTTNENQ